MASATKTRPAFGQTVTVKAKALRETDYGASDRQGHRVIQRIWKRSAFSVPRRAIFIGFRTKANGTVHTEYIDDGLEVHHFERDETFEMWMVIEDARTNPYFVWPDDCEVS